MSHPFLHDGNTTKGRDVGMCMICGRNDAPFPRHQGLMEYLQIGCHCLVKPFLSFQGSHQWAEKDPSICRLHLQDLLLNGLCGFHSHVAPARSKFHMTNKKNDYVYVYAKIVHTLLYQTKLTTMIHKNFKKSLNLVSIARTNIFRLGR